MTGTTTTIPRVQVWLVATNIMGFYQMTIVSLTGKTTNAGKCIGWNVMTAMFGNYQLIILITLRKMPVASAS